MRSSHVNGFASSPYLSVYSDNYINQAYSELNQKNKEKQTAIDQQSERLSDANRLARIQDNIRKQILQLFGLSIFAIIALSSCDYPGNSNLEASLLTIDKIQKEKNELGIELSNIQFLIDRKLVDLNNKHQNESTEQQQEIALHIKLWEGTRKQITTYLHQVVVEPNDSWDNFNQQVNRILEEIEVSLNHNQEYKRMAYKSKRPSIK